MSQLTKDQLGQAATSGSGGRARRNIAVPIALQFTAMVGLGALLFPSAANWFAVVNHNADISGYVQQLEHIPTVEQREALAIAQQYNEHLPPGMLQDPYESSGAVREQQEGSAYHEYLHVLPTSENGVIGQLTYPQLGLSVPMFTGISDDILSRGAGHIYGSSLPVGGPSTHAVLTAHSGLMHTKLFSDLPDAQLGDTFQINILGETHTYRVDQLETVLPEQTENLRIVPGEDYVTLITCTPIGVNSHRLLVRGERVPTPASASEQVLAGDGVAAGFPWWAAGFLAGSAAVAFLLFRPRRKPAPALHSRTATSFPDHPEHEVKP